MGKRWLPFSISPRLKAGLVPFLGLALAALAPRADAAPDLRAAAGAPLPTGLELIAFEAPGCVYCPVFRRDVAPAYGNTRAGRAAPLRFVDLNDRAADRFRLSSPITIVPTLVLVRDGVEIGRISGYVGPDNIHHILGPMLPDE